MMNPEPLVRTVVRGILLSCEVGAEGGFVCLVRRGFLHDEKEDTQWS